MHKDAGKREKIEWLNYWIESANEEKTNRILILGDSVARSYRPILNRLVQGEGYVVDLLAMSYSIFDSSLINEIEHFIESIGYQYNYIIFNLGAHHGYSAEIKNNKELQKRYFQILEDILRLLSRQTIHIITVSGTPERIDDAEANNNEIQSRNNILKSVSCKNGYQYVDLYSQLYDNKMFPLVDLFHFNDNGYEHIAYELGKALGFQIKNINSNRICSPKTLVEILGRTKKVYLYGDGKKGKQLRKYLCFLDVKVEKMFIVSDKFYKKENEQQISLSEIKNKMDIGDIILVTTEDMEVWEVLEQLKIDYCTLSEKVYSFIYDYIAAYINI